MEKIVHCDLCASNILLDSSNRCKISDFGLALSLKSDDNDKRFLARESLPPNSCNGTKIRTKWTAPESLNGTNFGLKSDVWSYSILLWELFSYGRTPYSRVPIDSMYTYLMNGNRMRAPEDCPFHIYELMKLCWMFKPIERPSFTFIKYNLNKNI